MSLPRVLPELAAAAPSPHAREGAGEAEAQAFLRQLLESTDDAPVLLAYVDAQERFRSVSAHYARWQGREAEALLGCGMREVLGEEGYGRVASFVACALGGARVDFEVALPHHAGGTRHVRACFLPHLKACGTVVGFGAVLVDLTSHRRAEERTWRLQEVTAALAEVTSFDQCAEVVLYQAIEALGGAGGMLKLVDEARGMLDLVAARGYPEEVLEAWRHIPLELDTPTTEAVRTGEPVFLHSPEEAVARFPLVATSLLQVPYRARVLLPLVVKGRVLGALAVSYPEVRTFDEEDCAFLLAVASQGAQALERAQLYERERQARQEAQAAAARLQVLVEASRAFSARQLDLRGVLETVARHLVGMLADACALLLLSPDGTALVPEVVEHVQPEVAHSLREVLSGVPLPVEEGRMAELVRSGASVLIPQVDVARLGRATHPAYRALFLRYPPRSLLLVPLRLGGQVMGTLALARDCVGHPFTREDQLLAEDVADRAALSIDTARAYAREREARAGAEAAARQLELLHDEARRAVQMRDEFLSVASHELKTPLTPLALRLQVLARELAAGGEGRPEVHLPVMQRQVRKLADLVEGLLDVSRIGEGRLSLTREPVDLVAVVREVVARHEQEAQRAGCPLHLELPATAVGQWDRLRLEQVVVNLVTNALKYGAGTPVRLAVEVEERSARLEVQDGGIGIDPVDVHRIFERFERAVSGRHYGGMGLGLYITRQIVGALGGAISVESQPGQGSCFRVELPRG